MARLTALSGLGGKSAAVFLLQIGGRRLLLDLGDGLEQGDRPDLSRAGRVDAVLLSHAHIDHAGGLDRLAELGRPEIHASAATLDQLPQRPQHCHVLPECGAAQVLGVPLCTGRAGHAPGGIWMRFGTPQGGFLYTGDFSTEAALLPCDPFPPAATVLADASYGDRDTGLPAQIAALAQAARGGAVLPCPADGRGPDMIAALARAGLSVQACPRIAAEARRLGLDPQVTDAARATPQQVIVAAGANAEDGLPAELLARGGFRFIFSSHVPRTSPAATLLAEGRAQWMGWNVHPRLCDLVALAQATRARRLLPAFVDPATAPRLAAALADRLCLAADLEI